MKMKLKPVALLLLTVVFTAPVHAQQVYIATGGNVSFFSETPVENIDAHTESMSSVLNTTNNEIIFTVPLRTFKFKKALMEEHFNENYVESERYPKSTFKGKINDTLDWKADTVIAVTASGDFTLHGVTKSITESGKLTINGDSIRLVVSFFVALKDYNIDIPKIVTKSIAENIKIDLNCTYIPYVKKK